MLAPLGTKTGLLSSPICPMAAASVLLLEMLNTGKHWSEPDDLKTEKLIEQLESKNGTDSLSGHPVICHVLFADGSV